MAEMSRNHLLQQIFYPSIVCALHCSMKYLSGSLFWLSSEKYKIWMTCGFLVERKEVWIKFIDTKSNNVLFTLWRMWNSSIFFHILKENHFKVICFVNKANKSKMIFYERSGFYLQNHIELLFSFNSFSDDSFLEWMQKTIAYMAK